MSDAKRPTTEIALLGRHYTIACDPGAEDKLERAARYLDRAMHGIQSQSNALSNDRVTVMAALNIAHELLEVMDEKRDYEAELTRLGERLDGALKNRST
ncbi:MAG: cell division protein ZapA [Halomonas sp.]|nr:cell division protein ZapA [Halomonas sp.]MDN6298315.1 cell division protein ZapA [Halomonas sp.]MDN6315556.1 cell division protein ZapA [Halomonas sp.]MDN6336958.1 cell division protein ZapA [Halomonas sp.]